VTSEPLTILLRGRHGAHFPERIRRVAPDVRIITAEQLKADESLIERVDAVYGRLPTHLFARAPRLKWVHTTAAGASWAQRPEVRGHPAAVTNSRIHAVQISEHLFGMLLVLAHRLHWAYARQLHRRWDSPSLEEIWSLPGKTLCVLGLGTIGRRCAALGAAFGMRVVGLRRRPEPLDGVEHVFGPEQLDDALRQGQVIMNLLPGTEQTAAMIGPAQFEAMPDGCVFLNAGRGSTVDTDALVAALRSGKVAAAGLDVLDPEPLPEDHPLWRMPNVILTAHYAGAICDYFQQTERLFLDNLRRFLAAQPLVGLVDKSAGY